MKKLRETIRIIIADDQELFRDGFRTMISASEGIRLLAEATNGQELILLTQELKPDVVITDIKMPVLDGISATRQLIAEMPDLNVLALSMFDDEVHILNMLEAGALGYLVKNARKSEIEQAVRVVASRQPYYCAHTTTRLAQHIARTPFPVLPKIARPIFSARERDVISGIAEGLASKQIAERLGLKARTVEGYREHIMNKMNVTNSAGLIVYAIKMGIIEI